MVERLRPPPTGRIELGDEICPGLLLRVTDRGVRSFSVIYKVVGEGGVSKTGRLLKGKQHRITLGQWPALKLTDAREQARDILSAALEGRDLRDERRAQNLLRATNTVESVTERFIRLYARPNVKSWRNIERVLNLHVMPHWGDRIMRDIRRGDVHELLDRLVAAGKTGTAREVRKHLSSLFNWAVDREIVPDNPLYGMTRADLKNTHEAGRALEDDELRAIWQAAGDLGYPFGSMYRLLILTGQRRNEWASVRRSEIDPDNRLLEIARDRYKGGRDHIIPLSDPAWALVETLPAWPGNDYHLFSTTDGRKPVSGFSRAKSRLDRGAGRLLCDSGGGLRRYRVHDFRVTCETRLANLGINQEVRDAVLGHAKPGLQKTYNKHDYMDEKRAALEAYAEHLSRLFE
jgi:integrase